MTILVTGAGGYVGNNTVRRLVQLGKPVRAMVRNPDKAKQRLGDLGSKIEFVEGNVEDRAGLKPLMNGVTAVIHLVAIPMEKNGATYENVNYQGTINIVDAAHDAGYESGEARRLARADIPASAKIREGHQPERGQPAPAKREHPPGARVFFL